MLIELILTTKIKKKFEVEFPIYRFHDCGGDDYSSEHYMRVDRNPDGTMTECNINLGSIYRREEQKIEISFDSNYHFSSDELYYNLGKGEYACTKEQFQEALAKATLLLVKINYGKGGDTN